MRSIDELEARILSLEVRVRRGRFFAVFFCLLAGAVMLAAFQSPEVQNAKQRFTEIDVERLNIVEPDGRLSLVLANKPRLPDVIVGGVEHDTGRKGTRGPGMLFFNHKGDECGGLTYSSFE